MRRVRRLLDVNPITIIPRIPKTILLSPPDILAGDPAIAAQIYEGTFPLAGSRIASDGRSPFSITDAPRPWRRALHSFIWLRHCAAADSDLSLANARALTLDWLDEYGRPGPNLPWRTDVAASRLRSWLAHSKVLLGHTDLALQDRFVKQLALHQAFLKNAARSESDPAIRLSALCSLGLASLAFPTPRQQQMRLADEIGVELDAQILPDGGHVSRRADILVDLLTTLLPLRQCYLAKGLVAPENLVAAIERMIPQLRMHLHADGGLAAHIGTIPRRSNRLAAVLEIDSARSIPVGEALETGFQRLAMGETIVIADTGERPPEPYARTAPRGSLSFELSSGPSGRGQRFITNLGPASEGADAELADAMRGRAAQSTVTLELGPNQDEAAEPPRALFQAASDNVTDVRRLDAEDGSWRGFLASRETDDRSGTMHDCVMTLTDGGETLRCSDTLRPIDKDGADWTAPRATIRFHLHPDITPEKRDRTVSLSAPDGQCWALEAEGFDVSIEDSLYCGGGEPRRTKHLVLRLGGDVTRIDWTMKRVSRSMRANEA